jgi:hydrogenase maturation factor HypF (carbamoyltransferase family)
MADQEDRVRTIVRLTGRVQGVGFRYQVMRLAQSFPVAGTVRNVRGGEGLEIDCEGDAADIERFLAAVIAQPPPQGRVHGVERCSAPPRGLDSFTIGETAE